MVRSFHEVAVVFPSPLPSPVTHVANIGEEVPAYDRGNGGAIISLLLCQALLPHAVSGPYSSVHHSGRPSPTALASRWGFSLFRVTIQPTLGHRWETALFLWPSSSTVSAVFPALSRPPRSTTMGQELRNSDAEDFSDCSCGLAVTFSPDLFSPICYSAPPRYLLAFLPSGHLCCAAGSLTVSVEPSFRRNFDVRWQKLTHDGPPRSPFPFQPLLCRPSGSPSLHHLLDSVPTRSSTAQVFSFLYCDFQYRGWGSADHV